MTIPAEPGEDTPGVSEPADDSGVDAALAGLAAAEKLSVEERVGALENVHRLLADALDPPGGDRPRAGA